MSPAVEDAHRPTRQRSNTGTFASFTSWRTRRPEPASTSTAGPSVLPASIEQMIGMLSYPNEPSINQARALAAALVGKSSTPPLAPLIRVLTSLCSYDRPSSLQAAGFDILAAYCDNAGATVLTTADRLECLSLFLDPSMRWSQDLWEPRYRALIALMRSGAETVGMEGPVLRVLEAWIEGAFDGLTRANAILPEEREERQKSTIKLTELLTELVGEPEFVSRLSSEDTTGVLQLWGRLIDRALTSPAESASTPASPLSDSKAPSPVRSPLTHKRQRSSTPLPQTAHGAKHPADIVVDAYVTYLGTRLRALAPSHLETILPLLFRSLAFYATPFPRISLTPSSPHQNALEKRILDMLGQLMMGPFSTLCTHLVKRFLVPSPSEPRLAVQIQISVGALKALRGSIRRVLMSRLARAYIARTSAVDSTPSGAPSQVALERDLMELAWAKDESVSWDVKRLRSVLCRATKTWVDKGHNTVGSPKESVLLELAGILKDIVQAMDEGGEDEVDDEEVSAAGDILQALVAYVHDLKGKDGLPVMMPQSQSDETSPLLNALAALLSRDLLSTALYPCMPNIILSVASQFPESETTHLLGVMSERQCLSPTTPNWLEYWGNVLAIPDLYGPVRPTTRQTAMDVLQSTWEFVKDIPDYRRPLADLVYNFWKRQSTNGTEDSTVSIMWRILGDEVVLRSAECRNADTETGEQNQDMEAAEEILAFLIEVATVTEEEDDDDTASIKTVDTHSPSPQTQVQFPAVTTAVASPVLSRMQSDFHGGGRSAEVTMPSVMSLLHSFTSGHSSRSQSQPPPPQEQSAIIETPPSPPEVQPMPKAVGAVVALASIFSQLAFTPLVLDDDNAELAVRVFKVLVELLTSAECARARLAALQFLVRLRVDRDHRLYFASADYDRHEHVSHLAYLIGRAPDISGSPDELSAEHELRRARPRAPQERNGRRPSRGRGGHPSKMESSRSRSRVARLLSTPNSNHPKARPAMWHIPEHLIIAVQDVDTPSERLISYDPAGPGNRLVLPLSSYLLKIVEIMKNEKEWEILSYLLCHLSAQLANKHLLCGPKSRVAIASLLGVLCTGIAEGSLASTIERWPEGVAARDATGLAYHTLTVLISYKRCFQEVQTQHRLVEVLLRGLSGQPSTIKCCIQALTLSAFELQTSVRKYLPDILEKLAQIMSNPAMAVHIIEFLTIVGSLKPLQVNFTEADYKRVFGVALQYLQNHNRPEETVTIPWALSQHVRVMSYYIVYLWFLAVKQPDRPHHVKFITRQLLLANEGKDEIDEPAEVCFDWLARYTYASADPRPAQSMLDDVVMNTVAHTSLESPAISEKTWILGNTVATIRALEKRGWMEVVSRRASGLTKFLCRAENVPMVLPGDADPDFLSVSASLTLDREYGPGGTLDGNSEIATLVTPIDTDDQIERPNPITGYVWSGTAPSQRRKDVAIDPAYFALQLSGYPDNEPTSRGRLVMDTKRVARFVGNFDRMPVIDTHKVGIMYVAPGQKTESEILRNTHGSPAYDRFLEGLARLIDLRGQVDVYAGGLDPSEDGEYAYAWWDDIGQVLYHTATLMPTSEHDPECMNKKRHIGNDYVRIVWNDSGMPYRFDTLSTQFQFVNIVIEPHSRGAIAAFSDNEHEHEYFQVVVQRAPGMTEFTPIGDFKLISAKSLPLLIRQLSLLTDWFVSVYQHTENDTVRQEMITNWRHRLRSIKKFKAEMAAQVPEPEAPEPGIMGQEYFRDFTTTY